MKLTDDVKQRKQKHFKQYRTAKQKPTNKENLVRFLHRGKIVTDIVTDIVRVAPTLVSSTPEQVPSMMAVIVALPSSLGD